MHKIIFYIILYLISSSFIYIVVKPSSKAIKLRAGCSNHHWSSIA